MKEIPLHSLLKTDTKHAYRFQTFSCTLTHKILSLELTYLFQTVILVKRSHSSVFRLIEFKTF